MATETTQTQTTTTAPPPPNGAPPVVQTEVKPPEAKVDATVASKDAPKVDDAEVALSLGDKKVEPKPGESAAPVELKLPDGLTKEDPAIKALVELAGKSNISVEAQQALLDQHLALGKARDQALADTFKAERREWLAESKALPDLGAGNEKQWAETLTSAKRALRFFGDQELVDWLNSNNGVNHPAMIRFALKVGKAMGEDNAIATSQGASPPPSTDPEKSLRDRYPTMYPKEK